MLELVIETVPSNTADSVELLRQTIENPEPGVPIQLRSLLTSPRAYMAPLQASLRVVSGDAGTVEDGILTIRMRRPRTIQGDGQ